MKNNELKTLEINIPLKDYIYFEESIKSNDILYDINNYEKRYFYVGKIDRDYIVVRDIIYGTINYQIKNIKDLSIKCRITSYNEVKRKCKFIAQTDIKFDNK